MEYFARLKNEWAASVERRERFYGRICGLETGAAYYQMRRISIRETVNKLAKKIVASGI